MLNLDNTTRLQFAVIDRISEQQAESIAALVAAATAATGAKAAAKNANEAKTDAGGSIWDNVLNIVEAVTGDEAAGELDATQLGAIMSAVVQNKLEGEAVKTVKSYLSTGRKVVGAIKTGRNTIGQFRSKFEGEGEQAKEVPVSYKEARELLKSSEHAALEALAKTIRDGVATLRGRENEARPAKDREADLRAVLAVLAPLVTKAEGLADANKKTSKAAKAASELRQQHPTTAGVVEVVKAPQPEVEAMGDVQRTGTEG